MADVTLTIRQGQGYISSLPADETLRRMLMQATSFRAAGYEHTRLFQRRQWDGRTRLLKNQKFPPGLAGRITAVLDSNGVSWEVINNDSWDTKPRIRARLIRVDERDYQIDAAERCLLLDRGIIRAPTGAGKTPIAVRIIQARGFHSVVIVPTVDLLYQFKEFLQEHLEYAWFSGSVPLPGKIGQLGDGVVDPQPVSVATLRTMAKVVNVTYESYEFGEYDDRDDTTVNRRELREWVDGLGTVVVDEAHILGARTVYETVTRIPAIAFFGLSASPWRDDGADLMIEGATGQPIFHIRTEDLVRDRWLVPPIIRVHDTRSWWNSAAWGKICKSCGQQVVTFKPTCSCGGRDFKSQFTDCYRNEIVENSIRNMRIAKMVQDYDFPTLVLVKQIKHGRLMRDLIPGSIFMSGKDNSDDRQRAFRDLRLGRARVLVATTIADMGLDIPNLVGLVLAGGGKSSTRHLQRIGRVARIAPNKVNAIVDDFDDGHVHRWFANHAGLRRRIERAEWGRAAIWL